MNSETTYYSRRDFLWRMAGAGSGLALLGQDGLLAQSAAPARFKIAVFSKIFQDLNFAESADLVARLGWDGIECPVRRGGHVLPERVEDDLPRFVEALRQRNLEIVSLATDIADASDPLTEKVLRTAARLGIKLYRLTFFHYDLGKPLPPQLAKIHAGFKDLLALNKELGLCAAFENHSGRNSVGAPVWDIYELIKDFDPRQYGVCFDIGHATIEGGLDWRIQFKLIESHLSAVYVKDFLWKQQGTRWTAEWVPLGQGMIHPAFLGLLKQSPFRGPIVQHIEYEVGRGEERFRALKHDRDVLRRWLAG